MGSKYSEANKNTLPLKFQIYECAKLIIFKIFFSKTARDWCQISICICVFVFATTVFVFVFIFSRDLYLYLNFDVETKFPYFLFWTCMSDIRNRQFRLYISLHL